MAQTLKLFGLAALPAAMIGLCLAAYQGLSQGEVVSAGPITFSLAEGHEARAVHVLSRARGLNSLRIAREESQASLALSPYNNMPRLRLAYLDWVETGRLTPAARQALITSYDLAAYDHEASEWRIRLALENWASVPAQTRAAVHAEAISYGRTLRRGRIVSLLRSIQDPDGQLRAALWLRELPGKPSFFDHAYR